MNVINGTFKSGQVVLDNPPDWPEGCRLRITPQSTATTAGDPPETPEEIEVWLRWYHALEPLEFTTEEEADVAAWRQKTKEYEIAASHKPLEGLFP